MTISFDLTTVLSVALILFVMGQKSTRNRWTGRLITLLLLSPGLSYLAALFTFPIRLQLSAWAGMLLRVAGMNVETAGNILIRQTTAGPVEMAVDPACMGLQMTGVSLLVALFFLIWQEQQMQRAVSLGWVIGYSLAAFGLTVLCNLFRIVFLVAFNAMPGTTAHELIGLVCLVAYAWLLAWFLATMLVQRFGLPIDVSANKLWHQAWGIGLVLVGIGVMFLASRPVDQEAPHHFGSINPASYTHRQLAEGIVQLTKPGVLVYIKPQTDWFSIGHSPATCWRGSGYELRQVKETMIEGHPAYVGQLWQSTHAGPQKNVLYTAWWFSNGIDITTSQFAMRSDMLRNKVNYVLVNITTTNQTALLQQTSQIFLVSATERPVSGQ
jgi:exosortase N